MDKKLKIVLVIFLITGSLYFIFIGLTHGKSFLIPLVTAIILAMVMNPVANKFRSWGVQKGWAVLFSDLIIVAFIVGTGLLFVAQANQVADNWPQIEKRLKPKIEQAQHFLKNKLNISTISGQQTSSSPDQEQAQKGSQQQNQQQTQQQNRQQQAQQQEQSQQQKSGLQAQQSPKGSNASSLSLNSAKIKSMIAGIVKNTFSIFSNLLLILVYVFFFMLYKEKFKQAVVKLAGDKKAEETEAILQKIAKTAQHYLAGRFLLILILAILYIIGFSSLGIKYAIFISIIAALFSLIPYLGNLIGLLLAITMSFVSGDGGVGQIIAIVAVFGVIQFVESYLLEPYIVGHEVDLNPVVVIIGVILGGIVWGVMGMILAIPVLGIIKVILDNTESLRPLGYVFDERDIATGENKQEKIKEWLLQKAKRLGIMKN